MNSDKIKTHCLHHRPFTGLHSISPKRPSHQSRLTWNFRNAADRTSDDWGQCVLSIKYLVKNVPCAFDECVCRKRKRTEKKLHVWWATQVARHSRLRHIPCVFWECSTNGPPTEVLQRTKTRAKTRAHEADETMRATTRTLAANVNGRRLN